MNSKNPLHGIFEATYLFTPDLEFGMTQAFSGQMDGTSGTGMGLNPPKPGSFGIWGPPTKKVVGKKLNQEPAKCAIAALVSIFCIWAPFSRLSNIPPQGPTRQAACEPNFKPGSGLKPRPSKAQGPVHQLSFDSPGLSDLSGIKI